MPFVLQKGRGGVNNPRYANGTQRRKIRARLKAAGGECGICHGRLGPIHYDEPSDHLHPLSFVVDEIRPISRYREYGYRSKEEAALDWGNVQAAHYCCNAAKSNKTSEEIEKRNKKINQRLTINQNYLDGKW